MRTALALVLALSPFAAIAGDDHSHDHGHDHGDEHAGEIHITHGWMAETKGPVARVFFALENEGDETFTLTGMTSPMGDVMLMAPAIKAGGDEQILTSFTLAPGDALEMSPDGLYVAVKISEPLMQGAEFPIMVMLDDLGELEIDVDVEGADAESISHAGHNH